MKTLTELYGLSAINSRVYSDVETTIYIGDNEIPCFFDFTKTDDGIAIISCRVSDDKENKIYDLYGDDRLFLNPDIERDLKNAAKDHLKHKEESNKQDAIEEQLFYRLSASQAAARSTL